ncbi:hypothetical protein [Streptomyces sp. AC495_CC817]|uniref:hypothetical protein n=1 Tax=Streptomyces sp. AC495_CC817 TaxID=2823900 RepID=UPI001C274E89|nr:hypothetical protein [Streptomyces sp. AC495_CC817]
MSGPQYAVIIRPDATQNVRACGPFRSWARADNYREAFDREEKRLRQENGLSDDLPFLPEIIRLERPIDIALLIEQSLS